MAKPLRYTTSPHLFAEALTRLPNRQVVRVAVIGDSKAGNPGTNGVGLQHELNAAAARLRRGVAAESGLSSFQQIDTTSTAWLCGGGHVDGTATRVAANRLLPGVTAIKVLSGSTGTYQRFWYNDYYWADAAADIGGREWLRRGYDLATASIEADVYAATNASSGEITWTAKALADPNTSVFGDGTQTATGTTALGLESGTFGVKKATIVLPFAAGLPYMGLILKGSDAVKPTDLIGVVFRSALSPTKGLVVHCFGAGGYLASSFAASHASAGELAVSLGYRVWWHRFGTNDSGNGITKAAWKANTLANIALIDSWFTAVGGVLHVIDPGEYVTNEGGLLTQYADAAYEIAQDNPHVMSLNLYQLATEADWDATGYARYLSDGVHHNEYGMRFVASHGVRLLTDPWSAELGSPVNASISADVAAVKAAAATTADIEELYVSMTPPLAVGTVVSTTGTTTTLDAGAVANADYYVGSRLVLRNEAGAGQERVITAYSVGRVATHAAWDVNPDASTTWRIEGAKVAAVTLPSGAGDATAANQTKILDILQSK